MAGGGKISARQKMINMMYLVLMALLALNVSSQILEAFLGLRNSIRSSAESFNDKNQESKSMIVAKVREEMETGNMKNEYIIGLTNEVSDNGREMKKYIDGLIQQLEVIADKDPETGEFKQMKELEANYRMWMMNEEKNEGRGDGEAQKLHLKLNEFIQYANDFITENDTAGLSELEFAEIAVEPKDDPSIPKSSDNKDKPWEFTTFNAKPVIADLALMEKFKMDVSNVEYDLLNFLKTKLGAVKFKIDSLILISAPMSQVVVAGMPFETKLFVSMASDDIQPEFLPSSGSISLDDGGNSGTLKINTSGGGFTKTSFEKMQSYSVKAKVPKADGGYEELAFKGEFKIRKPEVVITSASVQNLYWNCGNALNVDVPALGELYNPVFKASSAKVIPSPADKKKVTIVPTGKTCILSVSSNTNGQVIKVDDVKYTVIKPPKPSIVLMVNGKEYNGATPIPKKSNCIVRLRPDTDFAAALPKDARYMISKIDLLSQRSLGAPSNVGSFKGAGKDGVKGIPIALGNKLKSDTPGTKIYFRIDKIYRVNFQNTKVEEKFAQRDLMVSAVIK